MVKNRLRLRGRGVARGAGGSLVPWCRIAMGVVCYMGLDMFNMNHILPYEHEHTVYEHGGF